MVGQCLMFRIIFIYPSLDGMGDEKSEGVKQPESHFFDGEEDFTYSTIVSGRLRVLLDGMSLRRLFGNRWPRVVRWWFSMAQTDKLLLYQANTCIDRPQILGWAIAHKILSYSPRHLWQGEACEAMKGSGNHLPGNPLGRLFVWISTQKPQDLTIRIPWFGWFGPSLLPHDWMISEKTWGSRPNRQMRWCILWHSLAVKEHLPWFARRTTWNWQGSWSFVFSLMATLLGRHSSNRIWKSGFSKEDDLYWWLFHIFMYWVPSGNLT